MIRTFIIQGEVILEIYSWLKTNYPIFDVNTNALISGNDWSISNFSLGHTLDWHFSTFSEHRMSHERFPVKLSSENQVVMFKLMFGQHIITE